MLLALSFVALAPKLIANGLQTNRGEFECLRSLSNGGRQVRSQEALSAREAQMDRDGLLEGHPRLRIAETCLSIRPLERLQHRDPFALAQPVSNYLFEASVLPREGNVALTSKVGRPKTKVVAQGFVE